VHLETRISGQTLETDTPLQEDGRFDATFTVTLPTARRGWRIARNRATCLGNTAEKCCAVLTPPEQTCGVVVVLLPLAYTEMAGGAQFLANCEGAARFTAALRCLAQGNGGTHAIYYVVRVPPTLETNQSEWALATATLGWPGGPIIFLPSNGTGALPA